MLPTPESQPQGVLVHRYGSRGRAHSPIEDVAAHPVTPSSPDTARPPLNTLLLSLLF